MGQRKLDSGRPIHRSRTNEKAIPESERRYTKPENAIANSLDCSFSGRTTSKWRARQWQGSKPNYTEAFRPAASRPARRASCRPRCRRCRFIRYHGPTARRCRLSSPRRSTRATGPQRRLEEGIRLGSRFKRWRRPFSAPLKLNAGCVTPRQAAHGDHDQVQPPKTQRALIQGPSAVTACVCHPRYGAQLFALGAGCALPIPTLVREPN